MTNTSKIERETVHNNNTENGPPAPRFAVSGQTRDEHMCMAAFPPHRRLTEHPPGDLRSPGGCCRNALSAQRVAEALEEGVHIFLIYGEVLGVVAAAADQLAQLVMADAGEEAHGPDRPGFGLSPVCGAVFPRKTARDGRKFPCPLAIPGRSCYNMTGRTKLVKNAAAGAAFPLPDS